VHRRPQWPNVASVSATNRGAGDGHALDDWLVAEASSARGLSPGWAIADAAGDGDQALYGKLENMVFPLYRDHGRWLAVMKGAISRNASLFHSHRVMRR
jgi:starch phosphorylase